MAKGIMNAPGFVRAMPAHKWPR